MLSWLIDVIKCLVQGHCFTEWGNYRYCPRCGHLEVAENVFEASADTRGARSA